MTRSSAVPLLAFSALAVAAACGPALGQDAPAPRPAEAKDAEDETVRQKVERLLPDLTSDVDAVRTRAERDIVALGEPARSELERLTRDPDPQRAIAALKLLQSDAWDRAKADGGKRGRPAGPRFFTPPDFDVDQWQRDFERRMDDMRRRMAEWEKDLDWERWTPKFESEDGAPAGVRSSGSVAENGKTLRWTVDEAGKVRVTTKDGPDAAEQTVEADSLDALRKDHPDLAKRLDGFLPRSGGRRWVLRWPPAPRPDDGAAPGAEPRRDLRDGEEPLRPLEGQPAPLGPVLGIGWGDVPEVLREQLDLPAGGMVVESVAAGSLAERLGLRRNDVLLRIGDRVVSGPPDVRKALEAVPEGRTFSVEIVRKGRRETLTGTR